MQLTALEIAGRVLTSRCHLAAPQTGVGAGHGFWRPIGLWDRGILSFATVEQAMQGVENIRRNYSLHSQAAREIAREHFAAEKVLDKLLRDGGL